MTNKSIRILNTLIVVFVLSALLPGCSSKQVSSGSQNILVAETFLADIVRNVSGDGWQVDSLVPTGVDPHSFEPTPRDVARISESAVLVINGAGFEAWLEPVLKNAGGQHVVITASEGLTPRQVEDGHDHQEGDPHFWLDPTLTVKYVENIRDGLSQVDPAKRDAYAQNAAAYIAQLRELDTWIEQQVGQIPPEKRLLVTNHESFGYFAARYGFTVVGTLIPSASTSAAPSAQELTGLIDEIRATAAPAIFLETGTNPQLAEQIAAETGVKVITGLLTHSTTDANGEAPTYLEMMRYNTGKIAGALK